MYLDNVLYLPLHTELVIRNLKKAQKILSIQMKQKIVPLALFYDT